MYDTSNCPYFSESCPVCDDGECGCWECLERIEELKERLITRLNRITYNTRTDSTSLNITFFDEIAWLKSLRPTWKPSEEQMGSLNYAYCELFKREDVGHNILGPLQNLIDTLSKL